MTDVAIIGSVVVAFVAYCVGWLRGSLWVNTRWVDKIEEELGNHDTD